MSRLIILSVIVSVLFCAVEPHGRLLDPIARSSAWRLLSEGKLDERFPVDYNDASMFCGGAYQQWDENKGKCGICGQFKTNNRINSATII